MTLHPKIKELKLRSAPISYSNMEVGQDGELIEDNIVKGYLIVWGVKDSYGTVFLKGCCAKSLSERGPGSASKYKILMLWQHSQEDPIGQFTVLQEDDYGLYFEAALDDFESVPNARRAASQIKSGTLNQFSVGFDYAWDKMEYDETMDAILLKEIDLWEGSVVTIGANSETYAIRAGADIPQALEELHNYTEEFIKSLPRKYQFELRQLISRHKSLASVEPLESRSKALDDTEPVTDGIDYQYISKNLKLF